MRPLLWMGEACTLYPPWDHSHSSPKETECSELLNTISQQHIDPVPGVPFQPGKRQHVGRIRSRLLLRRTKFRTYERNLLFDQYDLASRLDHPANWNTVQDGFRGSYRFLGL